MLNHVLRWWPSWIWHGPAGHNCERGSSKNHYDQGLLWPSLIPVDQVVSEEKIFECVSPVSNVKLSSLLEHILDPTGNRRTQSLKGIIQEPLWPNLFPIDWVVSEKKIFDSVSPKGPMSTLRTCWVGPRPAGRNFESGPSEDRCN
jgi:hypothetical protein